MGFVLWAALQIDMLNWKSKWLIAGDGPEVEAKVGILGDNGHVVLPIRNIRFSIQEMSYTCICHPQKPSLIFLVEKGFTKGRRNQPQLNSRFLAHLAILYLLWRSLSYHQPSKTQFNRIWYVQLPQNLFSALQSSSWGLTILRTFKKNVKFWNWNSKKNKYWHNNHF
jgi:hypothetical protein